MDSPSYLPPSMIIMWRNGYDDTTGTPHGQAGANTSEGGMRSLQSTAGSRSSTRSCTVGIPAERKLVLFYYV